MSPSDPAPPDAEVLSDAELIDRAAARLAVPRVEPADSFVLHAPLELMARSALLRYVEPSGRELARQRIVHLAERFDGWGDGLEPSPRIGPPLEPGELGAIVESGDLDAIDRAAATLAATTDADALATALADLVVPQLSAAGHGSIFLYLLPRLLPASASAATMVRGLLRETGRRPEWRLTWMDERPARPTRPAADPDALQTRLLDPPDAGDPGSTFIHPLMSQVERTGLAAELLDGPTRDLSVPAARRQVLRVAAWSMLQDDPDHAPYGWSHALTMPQAVLGVAHRCSDPSRAVAVAATHELGFRSILGSVALDPAWSPDPLDGDADDDSLLDLGPDHAAAAVWHANADHTRALVREVVTYAAAHEDAHLVKYTLACLDAARDDPEAARLYRSAAAYLAGWWASR